MKQLTAMREADLFDVLLDLYTTYDTLEWVICLKILAAYEFGPRTIQLFWTYCGRLTMVARAEGYFGLPSKGYHGVTQVDPLYPMLFNVVMESVIHHWVTVVALTKDGREGLGLSIR